MSQIEWTEDLSVGLPEIDNQHKQLISIYNDLFSAIERNEGEVILGNIFKRLKEYTDSHFKDEEAYMQSIGYPMLGEHASEHILLLVRVQMMWNLSKHDKTIEPDGVAHFLREWIVDHVSTSDRQIGEFARSAV